MMRRLVTLSVLVVGLTLGRVAAAEDSTTATETDDEEQEARRPERRAQEPAPRAVALTLSPLHLILPVLELMAEIRVSDRASVAVIGGYGRISVESATVNNGYQITPSEVRFAVYEAGAQGSYYPVGNFRHGMQLGVEVLYIAITGQVAANASVSGAGEGLALGPFAGYKYTSGGGFTLDLQGGVEFATLQAKAEDTATGEQASGERKTVFPLVNLNAGWSF